MSTLVCHFMSWFDKIIKRQSTPDDSRDLKKGEVKALLANSFKTILPDFEFGTYKNSTYYSQRTRTLQGYEVYESLNVIFGLKDKMFSCSVASVFNKSYLYTSTYNNGFLTGHVDLLVIKSGSGASKIEDSYYWHNGKIATVDKVVNQIARDFRDFGLNYLDIRFKKIETSDLVRQGLSLIQTLTVDKDELKKEIETERKKAEYVVSRIKHPLFIQLRDMLQNVPDESREDRQKISGLTFELLELYYDK
jgi:hypothetical protein